MKKGFTLIELAIVVVVVSVLGFITYTQYQDAKAKARDVSRKSDLNEVSKAIQTYYADYNHLPKKGSTKDPDINSLWGKPFVDASGYVYLKQIPKEQYLTDKPYCYEASSKDNYFRLFTELESKDDPDCLEGMYSCGGKSYCYTDINYVSKT